MSTKTPIRAVHRIPSPVGDLLAVADTGGALMSLGFSEPGDGSELGAALDPGPFVDLERALERYFRGEREDFALKLAPVGTAFQQEVWRALRTIPWGGTTSYGEIAQRIGRPGAARAVGRANGTNPIAIVIPCHRVIGSDGTLTGYAGGLERKRALLALEVSVE